jgi:hypothetical protein
MNTLKKIWPVVGKSNCFSIRRASAVSEPFETNRFIDRFCMSPYFAQISAGALAAAIVLSAVVLLRGGV